MTKDLIYDVGMYDGSDTAYYLHRGYEWLPQRQIPRWLMLLGYGLRKLSTLAGCIS